MDVSTITGSNALQGIGTARFYWLDNNVNSFFYNLEDAIYYPSSLVNVVGITKLANDNNDQSISIQTFASASNFTCNHDQCQKYFKYGPANLPELPMPWLKTTSMTLATDVSKDQFNKLTPDDVTKMFVSLSKKESHLLLNHEPLSTLEKIINIIIFT